MHKRHVVCIVASDEQAINVINELRESGFKSDDVSVLLSDKNADSQFVYEKHSKASEGAVQGASTVGVLGGALGWLAGIGSLAIPGLGAFIAAGPILGALGGIAVGAAVGGVTGALIGMGIPEYEAKQYEGRLKEGNVLISVYIKNETEKETVKEIFKNAKAQDVTVTLEAVVR